MSPAECSECAQLRMQLEQLGQVLQESQMAYEYERQAKCEAFDDRNRAMISLALHRLALQTNVVEPRHASSCTVYKCSRQCGIAAFGAAVHSRDASTALNQYKRLEAVLTAAENWARTRQEWQESSDPDKGRAFTVAENNLARVLEDV